MLRNLQALRDVTNPHVISMGYGRKEAVMKKYRPIPPKRQPVACKYWKDGENKCNSIPWINYCSGKNMACGFYKPWIDPSEIK